MYLLVLWKGFLAADDDDHILPVPVLLNICEVFCGAS